MAPTVLAESLGLGPDTLSYYERLGLLHPADRTAAEYRLYDDEDAEPSSCRARAPELFLLVTAKRLVARMSEPPLSSRPSHLGATAGSLSYRSLGGLDFGYGVAGGLWRAGDASTEMTRRSLRLL